MKKNQTPNMEFYLNKIDLRTDWGKKAFSTIQSYVERKSPKLSLLKALTLHFSDRNLIDILEDVKPVDYQTDVDATCVCSRHLSKELYRMRLKGHVTTESPAYQINEKIAKKQPFQRKIEEFILGSECYKHLPSLLNDFGFYELTAKTTEGRKKNSTKIKEIINGFSNETKELLKKNGIDINQLANLSSLTKNLDINGLEARMLYDLDPGKKNSFSNWFREGIRTKINQNKEIIQIYKTLENAPQLLQEEDLAKLVVYQYEFRKHDVKAVLGNVKEDLIYLDSLPEENEIIKKYGKINLDKHYVRPATRFRSRENLENKTIKEKLNEEYLTFVEALGIQSHFPEIEKIRSEVNRDISYKYGIGRTWDYMLQRLSPRFFDVKLELAEEYRKFGKITKEKILTKQEYSILKEFFKRSSILESERESYLKLYSIPKFKEVAPQIATIGRKIKLAEKLGDENMLYLRKNYTLKEDAEQSIEEMIDMSAKAYHKNKNLLKFQARYGNQMLKELENGLVEKRWLDQKSPVKRWYNFLKNKKIEKFDTKLLEEALHYENTGLVTLNEKFKDALTKGKSYAESKTIQGLNNLHDRCKELKELDLEKLNQDIKEIKNAYSNYRLDYHSCNDRFFLVNPGSEEATNYYYSAYYGNFRCVSQQKINEEKERIQSYQAPSQELIQKITKLKELEVIDLFSENLDNFKTKFYVTNDSIREIEKLYGANKNRL